MEKVLVTGFGPFGNFPINASWEVVRHLATLDLKELNIELVTKEIEVSYDTVSDLVPKLWKEYEPCLVVHVGVSSLATKLTIETCANHSGYIKNDIHEKIPENGCCNLNGELCIITGIDVEAVCEDVNKVLKDVSVIPSCDAGRYLCEYTFYSSLCINPQRTVFVHVPDVNKPYTVSQMANGLKEIISTIIRSYRKAN